MSEKQQTANLVSNEAVIEDLTKDLEKSLTTDPDENAEYIINPGTSAEFAPSSGGDSSDIYDAPLTDKLDIENECQEDSEEEKVESDTDSIDEEAMKVAHASLTDEQIIELEKEAGDLKNSGNALFQSGKYAESLEKYTAGLKKCPLKNKQRAFLYSNRAAAKMKMEKYGRAIKDCTKAIEIDDKYLKAYSRRAQCYESTKKYEESLEDHKKVLELDIHNKESHAAVARLPRIIEQRNEELKTEMLGKLKDLGNMILKPFGLSTDNFKLQQDPESKGYTVNFQNKS